MPKFTSCHNAIMVVTGRAHCSILLYIYSVYIVFYIYIVCVCVYSLRMYMQRELVECVSSVCVNVFRKVF